MKKIIISVLILALLSNLTCFAANTVRGTYNEETKEVLVEGHLEGYKNAPAAVWILKEGKENEEYFIEDYYYYTVKVKPHSIKQFIIEYNLLANSCGNVSHKVTLK